MKVREKFSKVSKAGEAIKAVGILAAGGAALLVVSVLQATLDYLDDGECGCEYDCDGECYEDYF